MRATTWALLTAGLAGLVPGPAGGQPASSTTTIKVAKLADATTRFAAAVAADAGKDARLKLRIKVRDQLGRNGYYQALADLTRVLGDKVAGLETEPGGALVLGKDEQVVVEVTDPNQERVYRFAVAAEKQRDPVNPGKELVVLRCTGTKGTTTPFPPTYLLTDQEQVGKVIDLSTAYDPRNGLTIQAPPTPGKTAVTKLDAPGFGWIMFHKRVGPNEIDFRPLGFVPRETAVSSTVKSWRHRCPDLTADSAFEVVVYNARPHAWALEVSLDGRPSTAGAGKYKGTKYIVPGTPAGAAPEPCVIKGWLLEPKGDKTAAGVQTFEYAEFLVKNVPDADPVLAAITAECRSTVRIAWHGAWPAGTPRPADLPHPQSGGNDVVTQGKHGTLDLKVVEYTTEEKSLGSVVVEYGGRAAADRE